MASDGLLIARIRISSALPKQKLLDLAGSRGVLLLDPKKVASLQSLELAHHLAKSAFRERRNIAKKFPLEFLLWLSGKKDINSALDEMMFEDSKDVLVVSFGTEREFNRFLTDVGAGKKGNGRLKRRLALRKNTEPGELERISLGRT